MAVIPTRVVPSAEPAPLSPRQVSRAFLQAVEDGMAIRPAGDAKDDPESLLRDGYTPKHELALFDTLFFLTNVRENEDLRYFVAYVVQAPGEGRPPVAWPRIFYKDLSLVWRSASHIVRTEHENWIGKGDVKATVVQGEELWFSAEHTTDLPLEIQNAFETLSRAVRRIPYDDLVPELVLRNSPSHRVRPYRDFLEPRRRAQAEPRNLIHGGEPVAWFTRPGDPGSLRFARGFDPDFGDGVLEVGESHSSMYGGRIGRYRILSRNRRIQYLFMAAPDHVWIIPPQALTTELSSFGVRTVDVEVHDDLCIPGFEYHFVDHDGENGPELVTQIPDGYAGDPSRHDATRADTSAWLDALPVVQDFRREVLGRGGRTRGNGRRPSARTVRSASA